MAFTTLEKVKIRKWLGYPERFHDSDSRLEQAIAAIEDLDDSVLNEVRSLITKIEAIDDNIFDARKRLVAIKSGSSELPGPLEIAELQNLGRMYVGRLSIMISVHPRHDAFSASAPTFDAGIGGPEPGAGGGQLKFG